VTAPKRRTTRQQTELTAIAQIATTLQHQWHATEAVLAAQAAPTMRAAGSSSGGRSSDIPDPTYAIVATFTPRDELIEAISAALVQMRWIQTTTQRLLKQHPDTATQADSTARALRCDGTIDPTCTRNAVRNGLCWTCIKRTQRAEQRTIVDMSTPNVLHMPAVEVCPEVHTQANHGGSSTRTHTTLPAQIAATCGVCGWTAAVDPAIGARAVLAQHHLRHHG
jgi:hypothetical protein